jgi:hypothetical protein
VAVEFYEKLGFAVTFRDDGWLKSCSGDLLFMRDAAEAIQNHRGRRQPAKALPSPAAE